jgi:hypothetical protein
MPVRFIPHPVLRQDLLDVLEEPSRPEDPSGATAVDDTPDGTGPRRLRLLAAEDNKTNQLVFAKMLSGFDIDIEFANDGREAVDLFQKFRPDIIFTDISMPVMDGKDAAREIRALEQRSNRPRTPIVAMTAHALDGDEQDILSAGIDHYMTKPIRKAVLSDHILGVASDNIIPPLPRQPTEVNDTVRV